MSWLTPVYAILLRQLYLLQGSLSRVLPLFAWVAIDMVLWGFMTRYLNSVTASGHDFVPTLLGAVLLWDFFMRVMQGVTMTFFEDVWSRNFLNLFASPLTVAQYLSGLVLTSVLTSALGLVVMMVLATGVFGLNFASAGLLMVPFLATLFGFGIALGILACAMVLRLGPAAEWFVWPIPAIISPFAGVYYPVATLPTWMQYVARALPPSYVFEGLRTVVAGGTPDWGQAAIGLALSVGYVLVGGWVFGATFKTALRGGIIARYSAESVS